jgi:hypothetical protein
MSSDHAGICRWLERFENEMYRVLARVDDAREVSRYLAILQAASIAWLEANPHSAPWEPKRKAG